MVTGRMNLKRHEMPFFCVKKIQLEEQEFLQ